MAPSPFFVSGSNPALRALPWMLALAVLANAFAFAGQMANPLVYSDNWTFIDTFLRVALEEGAGFGDFLVKRAGVDHAQPLNKLLMLANARWFGLDFRLESWFGLACAAGGWLLLCAVVLGERRQARAHTVGPWAVALLLAAIVAVQVSPATADVYVYPMVTMAHAFYLLGFATLAGAWHAYRGTAAWPMVVAAAAAGIVGDDSAVLLVAAVAPALVLAGLREGRMRDATRVVVLLALVLLACRGIYMAFGEIRGSTHPDFNVGFAARVAGLAGQWREAWRWLVTPLTAGLVPAPTLRLAFGGGWDTARIALALLVAAAHGWFWWRALRLRPGATWFVAVALMLLFYAMVAGILYGRVFVRGADFLEQGRYAVFYQLGIVALLLMALAPGALRGARGAAVATCVALALLASQAVLAVHAWDRLPGYRAAYVVMARDMAAVARDPRTPPEPCAIGIDICVRPEATRIALMAMLVEHRLNLFSPRFRASHPDLAEAAGPRQEAPVR
ncbi:hypothetical protein WCE41_00660 [Luteimonas sp. MJ246]|uniref:hypothetical protein n=1 Tax=Luteimonas sp. MJ174 TaxID=3129237 RepID=UPI0031BAB9D7